MHNRLLSIPWRLVLCVVSLAPTTVRDWSGPRQSGETLPGNYPLNMAYFPPNDGGDTPPGPGAAPIGEWPLDALLNRVNHLSGPGLGGGGETHVRYGYHGINLPAWRDLPVPNAQNPMYMPGVVPGDSPGIGSPELSPLDNWGRVQRDIWQRDTGREDYPVRPYDPTASMAGGSTYTGDFGPGWLHHERFARDKAGRTTDTFDDALTWRTDPTPPTADPSEAMAGWDRTLGRDPCTGELTYCGIGVNPGSTTGGMLPTDGPRRVQRDQGWRHDSRGNWLDFADHRARDQTGTDPITFSSSVPPTPGGTLDGSVSVSPADSHIAAAFNDADMPTTRLHKTADHSSGSPAAVITHDANGHCTDNGRWVFKYTPGGQLAEVYRRGGSDGDDRGEGTTGSLFARFEYNALGWRISACYDVDSPDGDLDNETRELYLYDTRWRLVGVMTQGAEGTGGAESGLRPAPRLRERYIYHRQGLRGFGSNVTGLDQIVCRHRDADDDPETSLPDREDGLEEVIYYMQNHRGDVVGVLDSVGVLLERVRYSAYGEPQALVPVDINGDGILDPDDLSDYLAWYFAYDDEARQASPPWTDFDSDGDIDPDDLSDFIVAYFAVDPGDVPPFADAAKLGPPPSGDPAGLPPGVGSLSRPSVANRFGFAGYVWDDHLGLYHVRHRAYDPYHGRWLQPDPIGMAGGFNLYQYCGGEPIDRIDPMGLEPEGGGDYGWGYLYNLFNFGSAHAFDLPGLPRPSSTSRAPSSAAPGQNPTADADRRWDVIERSGRQPTVGNLHDNPELNPQLVRLARGIRTGALAAEAAVGILNEGVDWAMTIAAIVDNPRDWMNYAGFFPFVPSGVRHLDDLHAVQRLGRAYDSGTLGYNLSRYGIYRGADQVAHHIIGNSRAAQGVRDALNAAGIDINDVANGMILDVDFHHMLNNQQYRDDIIQRFRDVPERDEFLKTLDEIKSELATKQDEFRKAKQSPQGECGGGQ